ncbi:hypothetical protein JT359_12810 [Candidatus Poribacteria bacterium]|nr:hypothetical protein [Candidatus Poribacteria bacterium]
MAPNFGYKVFQLLRNNEVTSYYLPIIIFLTYIITEYVVQDGGWLKNIMEITIILFCSIYIQQFIFLIVKVWKKIRMHQGNENRHCGGKQDIDNNTIKSELIT